MSRILALDYGTKRVGVAISDPTGTLASPLPFLAASPFNKLLGDIVSLVKQHEVERVLVGLPKNMDGSLGASAQGAKSFAEALAKRTPVPIKMVDERMTTVQATRMLHEAGHNTRKQREKVDSAAAQILLQQFLDAQPNPP